MYDIFQPTQFFRASKAALKIPFIGKAIFSYFKLKQDISVRLAQFSLSLFLVMSTLNLLRILINQISVFFIKLRNCVQSASFNHLQNLTPDNQFLLPNNGRQLKLNYFILVFENLMTSRLEFTRAYITRLLLTLSDPGSRIPVYPGGGGTKCPDWKKCL